MLLSEGTKLQHDTLASSAIGPYIDGLKMDGYVHFYEASGTGRLGVP
jgi:hypothetical protein